MYIKKSGSGCFRSAAHYTAFAGNVRCGRRCLCGRYARASRLALQAFDDVRSAAMLVAGLQRRHQQHRRYQQRVEQSEDSGFGGCGGHGPDYSMSNLFWKAVVRFRLHFPSLLQGAVAHQTLWRWFSRKQFSRMDPDAVPQLREWPALKINRYSQPVVARHISHDGLALFR